MSCSFFYRIWFNLRDMHAVTYVLLISLGAFLLLGVFHFIIYLQQRDKAFRNYALYLFTMALFNVLRLLDERLTQIYPLPVSTVATLDPVFSNLGFLMYTNFLGTLLNIRPSEKLYYFFWKGLQFFIPAFLLFYVLLMVGTGDGALAKMVITIASFICLTGGLVMTVRLFRLRKDIFYQLIIAGTLTAVIGIISGFAICVLVYHDNLAFQGIYFLEAGLMVESAFLSAALGYRLKMAFVEKEKAQQILLEETRKREALANETARLLQQELSIREVQQNISRDLHDDVGASLSSLQIYSELAAKFIDTKPQEARNMLKRIAADASKIMEHMGHIVWAIQPADSPSQSLEARIRAITYDLLSPRGIFSHIELSEAACLHCNQPELRRALVLMIKESVNNAAKYSNAHTVKVQLELNGTALILKVEDDGIGFDPGKQSPGNGIENIRSRAARLGGKAEIITYPGKGTRIECCIPLTNSSDKTIGIKS